MTVMWSSAHFPVAYRPASQMVTDPPPYSPAVIVPANAAYSSGWSSVGTASRLGPFSVGGPFGTAQLFRTPSRSSRRSQCTRSPVRPRGVWCSWTTKVSSLPSGSALPEGGTGSAVRAGSRLARYSASGSCSRPRGSADTSGAAAGAVGRTLVRRLLRGRLLRGRLLRGRAPGRCCRGRRLLLGVVRGVVPRVGDGAIPGPLDAAAQGAHQVDDGSAGVLELGDRLHLATALLGLEQRGHGLAVVVGELGGVEGPGHGADERLGHLQLLRPDADVLVQEREVGTADLVGPAHRVQHQDAVAHPHRRQRLALPDGDLGDGDLAGVVEGVAQEHVRTRGRALGLEVVRLLEHDGVDLVLVDELQDLDLPPGAERQFLEVLVGEDDDLAVGQLITLGDVAVLDLVAVDRADPLVLDPPAVGRVDLVEPDVLVLGRRVQLHADADEAERHGPAPDRSHAAPSRTGSGPRTP